VNLLQSDSKKILIYFHEEHLDITKLGASSRKAGQNADINF
jgi:hypothetical protein